MHTIFYYTSSENNQLNKSLSRSYSLTGAVRGETNVIRPQIMYEAASLDSYNYAYIQEFERYYFVREIRSIRNGLWLVSLEVDPLMSFKSAIENLKVILQETEGTGEDNYLSDSRVWVTKVKDKTDIIQFPSGLLNNGTFILITAGG